MQIKSTTESAAAPASIEQPNVQSTPQQNDIQALFKVAVDAINAARESIAAREHAGKPVADEERAEVREAEQRLRAQMVQHQAMLNLICESMH